MARFVQSLKVIEIACISERIEVNNVAEWLQFERQSYKCRTDESRPACDENIFH
jgi:hypothetical protein